MKNVTRLTREILRDFQKVHYRMRIMRFQIVFTILFAAAAGFCFWKGMLSAGIGISAVVVFFNLSFLVIYLLISRRYSKAFDNANAREVPIFIYEFYENTMTADAMINNDRQYTSYSYNALHGVAITGKIIMLFVTNTKAFIVDRNGFSDGICDEFINTLRRQVPSNRIKNM